MIALDNPTPCFPGQSRNPLFITPPPPGFESLVPSGITTPGDESPISMISDSLTTSRNISAMMSSLQAFQNQFEEDDQLQALDQIQGLDQFQALHQVQALELVGHVPVTLASPFDLIVPNWKGLPMIIKMTNISWDITRQDVINFTKGLDVGNIHIPIDRNTGKTKNQVFLEIYSHSLPIFLDSMEGTSIPASLDLRNGEIIKGRSIAIVASTWKDLISSHFPHASPERGIYLTREEINAILNVCRNYKASVRM